MTINQMRCFSAVAKELNFAKAAKELYISQPAVTHQIQLLENELGVQLFYRTSRTVSLTPAGLSLFQEVDDILERIEMVSQRVTKAANSSVINIGCVSTLALPQLPEIYEKFRKKEPDVMINMIDVPHYDFKGMASSQLLDVVFTPRELISRVPEFRYQQMEKGRLFCVVRTGHRFEDRPSLSFSDLSGETIIMLDNRNCPPLMGQVQQLISAQAEDILINFSSSSTYTGPMVLGGIGIAVMPDFVIPDHPDLRRIPFDIHNRISEGFGYGIAYRKTALSRAQKSLIEVVKEFSE